MKHVVIVKTPLQECINNFFIAYKDDIIALHTKEWKDEDLRGKSYNQWKIQLYYDLLYLCIIIYTEKKRLIKLKTWSYFVSTYKLVQKKECLACEGIVIQKGLDAFNLGSVVDDIGIELMLVETNFEVQPGDVITSTIKVKDLITNPYTCNNIIKSNEVPQDADEIAKYFDTIQDTISNENEIIFDNE